AVLIRHNPDQRIRAFEHDGDAGQNVLCGAVANRSLKNGLLGEGQLWSQQKEEDDVVEAHRSWSVDVQATSVMIICVPQGCVEIFNTDLPASPHPPYLCGSRGNSSVGRARPCQGR